MGIANGRFAKMENRGGKNGARMALGDACHQVFKPANPARRDNRHRHRIGDGAGERQVIAIARPIPIHRGDKDFACPQVSQADRMGHCINAGWAAAAMGEDFPMVARPPGVDARDDALASKPAGNIGDQLGPGNCGRIHRHLISARQ